jgi:hypothetical protein
MKLHSPSFEKKLRQDVKKTVKASPALKRERKRLGSLRRNYSANWIIRPVCSGVLGAIAGAVTVQTGHLVTGLAVINLWMLGALWFQSNGIQARLYRSADIGALALWPISHDRIFRWQSQKCLRHFLLGLLDLSVALEVQACLAHLSPAQWVAAFGVAILSWIVMIALATFHAARFSRSPMPFVSLALIFTGVAVLYGRSLIGPIVMRILDQVAPQMNVVLPTGWSVSQFRLLGPEPQWWTLLLLLPVAVVIATLPDSVKRLRSRMRFHEHVIEPAMDLIPGEDVGEVEKQTSRPAIPKPLGPTAIEEIILSRIMFCPPTWPHRGWMERWL